MIEIGLQSGNGSAGKLLVSASELWNSFPKPQIACSTHAGGANEIWAKALDNWVFCSSNYPTIPSSSQGFLCQLCVGGVLVTKFFAHRAHRAFDKTHIPMATKTALLLAS